jgi:hypothetical protein
MNTEENNLEKRIEELERKLSEHQHLGVDGSKEFDGKTQVNVKEINIEGMSPAENLFAIPTFRIFDKDDIGKERRKASMAIGISDKGGSNEQDNFIFQVGKGELEGPSNRQDWDKKSFSQLILTHDKNDYPWFFFSKETASRSYLTAKRTPIVFGEGSITGDTLLDNNANFPIGKTPTSLAEAKELNNSLIHSICMIKDSNFNTLEAIQIFETTKNTLKFSRSADTQGEVRYEILNPIILGSLNAPFGTGYFGDGLILGYGTRTTNNKISSITWGVGSPEGNIFAAPGSLYLNQSGGANTTLYIKETGTSNTGWVAK